ncbi:MAG: polyphosphate kinase 1 [Planctomycetes bacterium]|nr:polyphosphate kinase 1 [Planctomycetota bacterium]
MGETTSERNPSAPTLPSLLDGTGSNLIHRDLSWLQFNDRVLAEARASSNPPLERLKFLGITASNLDEFFMIRFASLARRVASAVRTNAPERERLQRVRNRILETASRFVARQAETLGMLATELAGAGLRIAGEVREGGPAWEPARRVFEEQVRPRLTPRAGFAFPNLRALPNLWTAVLFPGGIWFELPRTLPPVLHARDGTGVFLFFLDDLIRTFLGGAVRAEGAPAFARMTRDGDFNLDLTEEDPETIPDLIRSGVGSRELGRPVRIQSAGDFPSKLLGRCISRLRLSPAQVLPAPRTLFLHGLSTLAHELGDVVQRTASLTYPARRSFVPGSSGIFERIRKRDILLHHPYDSFDTFVKFVLCACEDPGVERIEQTIYRVDRASPELEALKGAARRKTVRVIIEPRARFDELNNLRLAEELAAAGVEVGFGFGRLKLHAKIALVTRREADGVRLYTHLSTGNYNTVTARQYEDLAILTAHPGIGADGRRFFDAVWDGRVPEGFRALVQAPGALHRRLLALIRTETEAARHGRPARIAAKVNALVDPSLIGHLYVASQAGVAVDLVVRGACSLIPGVKGLSENVRVVSVVDRYLEHSRIYSFAASRAMYFSSADWMPRNFFSRLELAFPVLDPHLVRFVEEIVLPAYLGDTVKARELTPQGAWRRRSAAGVGPLPPVFGKEPIRSQFFFESLAAGEYRGTPLEFEPQMNAESRG